MPTRIALRSFLLTIAAGCASAQPVMIGAGYDLPAYRFSPGQVVTVFVDGLDLPEGTDVHAAGVPLPHELTGISATLVQREGANTPRELPVPLFRVVRFSDCSRADLTQPCAQRAAVTLQIPAEASAIGPRPFPLFSDLFFSQGGVRGPAVNVGMIGARIHLLRTCDSSAPEYIPQSPTFCVPILTSGDGSLVGDSVRPARPGDTLVAWAFGMGATEPLVPSGATSPNPPAVLRELQTLLYRFEFPALGTAAAVEVTPAFARLTPGFVGLYQINLPLPKPSNRVPPCDGEVRSNARLSVIGAPFVDGDSVELCVEAP